MGDRADVWLKVHVDHHDQVIALAGNYDEPGVDVDSTAMEVTLEYYEINYANLPFLEKLVAAGIPYQLEYGAGGSFDAGAERFTIFPDGSHSRVKYSGDLRKLLTRTDLDTLLSKATTIEEAQKYVKRFFSWYEPIPLKEQIEYRQAYMNTVLIAGMRERKQPKLYGD